MSIYIAICIEKAINHYNNIKLFKIMQYLCLCAWKNKCKFVFIKIYCMLLFIVDVDEFVVITACAA
ncbi:hypothetical protein BGI05_10020 [Snodgrassella alvi]|nr:hypothetical protein BGH97_03785 [Snodgrassella alvi]ORF08427.1 hypothetical protein BGH99_05825 [Snodgrassella alvi]ORF13952.1 hypothetical protein BGI00_03255 [Snodgrassella alvi]ORF14682.1 hypothetical protein BGI02_04685 [Snodgrassella alvi]ORF18266.1 hypothetical protein BGI05_10020 [Snodgrassella alvi]